MHSQFRETNVQGKKDWMIELDRGIAGGSGVPMTLRRPNQRYEFMNNAIVNRDFANHARRFRRGKGSMGPTW